MATCSIFAAESDGELVAGILWVHRLCIRNGLAITIKVATKICRPYAVLAHIVPATGQAVDILKSNLVANCKSIAANVMDTGVRCAQEEPRIVANLVGFAPRGATGRCNIL